MSLISLNVLRCKVLLFFVPNMVDFVLLLLLAGVTEWDGPGSMGPSHSVTLHYSCRRLMLITRMWSHCKKLTCFLGTETANRQKWSCKFKIWSADRLEIMSVMFKVVSTVLNHCPFCTIC